VGSSLTKPISLSKYLTFLVVGMGNLEMISRHSDDRIRPDAFVVNRGIDKYENHILHLAKRLVKKSWNFVGSIPTCVLSHCNMVQLDFYLFADYMIEQKKE
jgi:hypothetical protein